MSRIDTVRPSRFALLANPTRFLEISGRVLPYAYGAAAVLLVAGLAMALRAPEDYQQGITVRILFVHVPFAWLSMMTWTVMSLSALGLLVWRHPIAEVAIRTAAPIGAVFTFLCLFTGSVWGRPMWGTWWVWDARLTSVFVLFLMYLGLIALTRAFDEPQRAGRMSAVFVLVGFLVIPIIKFSVDWWNTLHQPASVLRMDGPSMDASYLWPLFLCAAGFTLLFFALHLTAMRTELRRRRIASLERRRAGAVA
ncbi:heme ABC transporter permease [Aureimonas jatrophae]|uniref:Heme exporter protein C n=1 Tax=Aureimonas jatrophae TaxID=1166073 RepID=A0A1H0BXV3_9HYPH|nr:heme ABC transporter permease [Aureimonas jatrophae]MBB3948980.1 heme exporter protein C [Aureimonas jatrophae]SDN50444.1 heme exporter protein C [Aureimonas jatrophae]